MHGSAGAKPLLMKALVPTLVVCIPIIGYASVLYLAAYYYFWREVVADYQWEQTLGLAPSPPLSSIAGAHTYDRFVYTHKCQIEGHVESTVFNNRNPPPWHTLNTLICS